MRKFFTSLMQFHYFLINFLVKKTYFIRYQKLQLYLFSTTETWFKTNNISNLEDKHTDRFKTHFNTSLDS